MHVFFIPGDEPLPMLPECGFDLKKISEIEIIEITDTHYGRSKMVRAGRQYKFEPDYEVLPGETLKEVMDSLSMSQKELALRTGLRLLSGLSLPLPWACLI